MKGRQRLMSCLRPLERVPDSSPLFQPIKPPARDTPVRATPLEVGQRPVVLVVVFSYVADNSCLSARILLQDLPVVAGNKRCRLAPVEPNEPLRDFGCEESQFSSAIVSLRTQRSAMA